jgi:hypothetical protein
MWRCFGRRSHVTVRSAARWTPPWPPCGTQNSPPLHLSTSPPLHLSTSPPLCAAPLHLCASAHPSTERARNQSTGSGRSSVGTRSTSSSSLSRSPPQAALSSPTLTTHHPPAPPRSDGDTQRALHVLSERAAHLRRKEEVRPPRLGDVRDRWTTLRDRWATLRAR